jgi:hypothetical protein
MKFNAQFEKNGKDIEICKNILTRDLISIKRLLAKYSAIDKGFKLTYDSTGKRFNWQEFDFRQELLQLLKNLRVVY